MKKFIIILFLVASLFGVDYKNEISHIKTMVSKSLELFQKGESLEAKKTISNAYFQHFENIEGVLGINDGKMSRKMEKRFNTLRKIYASKGDVDAASLITSKLLKELDVILPVLINGHQLVAQEGNTSYDKAAATAASVKANEARAKAAAALFARMKKAKVKEIKQLDPRLVKLRDEMFLNLELIPMVYQKKNYVKMKELVGKVLFDEYRNTDFAILVKRYSHAGLDRKIQRELRSIKVDLNNKSLSKASLDEKINNIKAMLNKAFYAIPKEQIANLKGFKKQEVTKDYTKALKDIKLAMKELKLSYKPNSPASVDALQSIYLDIFEASGMENKIGAVDTSLKLKIEGKFSNTLALIKQGSSKEKISKSLDELYEMIQNSMVKLNDNSALSLFIWSLGIILREGLEAIIIVVAITAYLIKSNHAKKLNIVYSALWTGVFLSFITAFLISWIFKKSAGVNRELLEGFTMLVAVVMLFYVGFWMLFNANEKNYLGELKEKIGESLSKNSIKALWFTVFLAVYREGAECVLFYQALLMDANTMHGYLGVGGGLGLGIIALIAIFFILKSGALRLPLKQFFLVSSFIIFYMIFVFTGKGVMELVEGKLISPTIIGNGFKEITWLGIYPYYQSLLPQVGILALILFGVYLNTKRKGVSKRSA